MKTRVAMLLAIAGCSCLCGCESVRDASITGRLWHERDYIAPSPVPNLALFQTPKGILAQYDAEIERTADIRRRAYYVEPNLKQIAAGQKPVFVDPATAGPQVPIPIFTHAPARTPRPGLFAVCSSNFCTFTVFRGGEVLGPCDLPVYKDSGQTAKQAALTPLAVAGDASVVAYLTSYIWLNVFATH